jgi:hypothetical protein
MYVLPWILAGIDGLRCRQRNNRGYAFLSSRGTELDVLTVKKNVVIGRKYKHGKQKHGKQKNIWITAKCLFYRIDQLFHGHFHQNDIQYYASFLIVDWSIQNIHFVD